MRNLLIRWAALTLFFALLIGGKPWRFPAGGKYWLERIFSANSPVGRYRPTTTFLR